MLVARAALRLLRYTAVRSLVARVPARSGRMAMTPAECEVALRRAAVVLPGSSCLVRAFAAACLLRRNRHASVLTIGVDLVDGVPASRDLHAHAWLESEGIVVVGAEQRTAYRTLLRDAIPAPR